MTITQTVEIPANRRLTIEVPPDVPTGRAILTFAPATETDAVEECPECAKHRDPVTGELRFNAETMAALQETSDIMSGKIPGKWHHFSSGENNREELRQVLKEAMQEVVSD